MVGPWSVVVVGRCSFLSTTKKNVPFTGGLWIDIYIYLLRLTFDNLEKTPGFFIGDTSSFMVGIFQLVILVFWGVVFF